MNNVFIVNINYLLLYHKTLDFLIMFNIHILCIYFLLYMMKNIGSETDIHDELDPVLWESFTGKTSDIITKCHWCDDNFWENSACLKCEQLLGNVLKGWNTDLDEQIKNSQ